jgi:DNA-binding NarL/FixJ family response regulator
METKDAPGESRDGPAVPGRARVMVVDDHPIFRRGLRELIEDERDLVVCAEAADAGEALRLVKAHHPDVAVVDLSLKGGHGLDLIEQIREHDQQIRVLVCSVHPESHFAERVLHAGAMGYLSKQEAADKLIEAIRQILGGEIYVSAPIAKRLLHSLVGGKRAGQSPIESLTNREMQIFEMIGRGLTTKQIARELLLSPKTVEAHREKIKTKLSLPNSVQLSYFAFHWVHEQQ